jgi:hypothetical protein
MAWHVMHIMHVRLHPAVLIYTHVCSDASSTRCTILSLVLLALTQPCGLQLAGAWGGGLLLLLLVSWHMPVLAVICDFINTVGLIDSDVSQMCT